MLRCFQLLFSFIISISVGYSQDLLIKTNGDTLSITEIEINDKYLIYKIVGSNATLLNERRILDKILYSNGDVFDFKEGIRIIRKEEKIYTEDQLILAQQTGKLTFNNGLFAPSITYQNGKLNSGEVIRIYELMQNEEALKSFKSGRRLNIIGNIIAFPSGYILGQELYKSLSSDLEANKPLLIGSLVVAIISISFNGIGISKIKDSVRYYNKDVKLHLESTPNGIGMVFKF